MPGAEKGVLIQAFTQYPGSHFTTAGEAWRQVRNNWIIPYGGSLVIIMLVATLLYYFVRGPLGGGEARTGRVIERFTYFERAAHWSNAVAFVVLALSGIVMAWGQFFLLPVPRARTLRLARLCAQDRAQLLRAALAVSLFGRLPDLPARQLPEPR